jgi:hypothetical protein
MSQTEHQLQKYIQRKQWAKASRELFVLLDTAIIDVGQYDVWGNYAGEIERGLRTRWAARERFWRNLQRYVEKTEATEGIRTHKGLIYFKIGAMSLFTGRSPSTILKWFRRAYEQDQDLWRREHRRLPTDESAYRLLSILGAFDRFCVEIKNRSVGQIVIPRIEANRSAVGKLLASVYDRSLTQIIQLPRLTVAPFDTLLGRNKYRVSVEQNYRAAEWLCTKKTELARMNIEQYGVAQAVVTLCGSTVEGILLRHRGASRGVQPRSKKTKKGTKTARRFPSLDSLVSSFLKNCRPTVELASGLIFILFARNLIHPDVARRFKSVIVDMNFADFTLTLTGSIIARLARRSRRSDSPVSA